MAAADTIYAARFERVDCLERGRLNTITCPVYRDDALVPPTANGSTVSVYDADGTAIVDAAAVTVTANVATYAIPSATLPVSLSVEDGWRIEWLLVMPDGVAHTFRRAAMLVRRALYPVVTDTDLVRRHSDLRAMRPSTQSSYQDAIDEAWVTIENRLLAKGNRPNLIMDPTALRELHIHLALHLIFTDFSTTATADGRYAELAADYERKAENDFKTLTFSYDSDEDGIADDPALRRPAEPITFLVAPMQSRGRPGGY